MTANLTAKERNQRMQWWREARFGMFIHWGLYSQIARHEWVMGLERIPVKEYEGYADSWKPTPGAPRQWARLARDAGMKYMVLTTKHLEGFCLWDTEQTDYNAVRRGPGRDLVREYVDACREFGLRVGFYYCLMDWHHPDVPRCTRDEDARRRFVDFTHGCVRELMTNYGRIDIMWYDCPRPLGSPELWESEQLNDMVRQLQPDIIINDRSQLPQDFTTPEEEVTPARGDWEACMTFNGSWGWMPAPEEDWLPVRKVIGMLSTCAAKGGNLLLNVGPKPDGDIPTEAQVRLRSVGQWLETYGPVIYGKVDRLVEPLRIMPVSYPTCGWSRKNSAYYFWIARWPTAEFAIGGMRGRLLKATWVANGEPVAFRQEKDRIVFSDLPRDCPDPVAGVTVIKLEFEGTPFQQLGCGYEYMPPPVEPGTVLSPYVTAWRISQRMPKSQGWTLDEVEAVGFDADLGWSEIGDNGDGMVDVHTRMGNMDGYVYLVNRFKAAQPGTWRIHFGHDGGAKVFMDRRPIISDPLSQNPADPWRHNADVELTRGRHEVVIALDLNNGRGYGIFFRWEQVSAIKDSAGRPIFPEIE